MDRRDRDYEMDRRGRDRDYGRNNYATDYSGYKDYDRNDEHYHTASNLTNQFEREYKRHRGFQGDDRDVYRYDHTYHEGNMGDLYERRRREVSGYGDYADDRNDRDRNRNDFSHFNRDRDSFSQYSADYRRDDDRRGDVRGDQDQYWRDRDRSQEQRGNRREGYLRSYDDDTFERHNTSRRESGRGAGYGQKYNTGFADSYRGSRYSDRDRNYIGGPGIRSEDDRNIPGRRSYLQNRYY